MRQTRLKNGLGLRRNKRLRGPLSTIAATALAGLAMIAATSAQATPFFGAEVTAGALRDGGSGQFQASKAFDGNTSNVTKSASGIANLRTGTLNVFALVQRSCPTNNCFSERTGASAAIWDSVVFNNRGQAYTQLPLNLEATGTFLGTGSARFRVLVADSSGGFNELTPWHTAWEGAPNVITNPIMLLMAPGLNRFRLKIQVEASASTASAGGTSLASLLPPQTRPAFNSLAMSPDYSLRLNFSLPQDVTLAGSDSGVFLADRPPTTPSVPEPAALGLFGAGLAGLAWRHRRRIAA